VRDEPRGSGLGPWSARRDRVQTVTALEVHDHLPGTLARLIDDLIEFSRLSRSELRRTLVDMDQVVRNALAQVQPDEPSHQIAWLFEPLPDAFADDGVLRLVWANLLDNAIKHTSPHLRARIEIGGRTRAEGAVEAGATFFLTLPRSAT
jgi:light-regulated signal transduction histidine kinase (bacteriophytochrome)